MRGQHSVSLSVWRDRALSFARRAIVQGRVACVGAALVLTLCGRASATTNETFLFSAGNVFVSMINSSGVSLLAYHVGAPSGGVQPVTVNFLNGVSVNHTYSSVAAFVASSDWASVQSLMSTWNALGAGDTAWNTSLAAVTPFGAFAAADWGSLTTGTILSSALSFYGANGYPQMGQGNPVYMLPIAAVDVGVSWSGTVAVAAAKLWGWLVACAAVCLGLLVVRIVWRRLRALLPVTLLLCACGSAEAQSNLWYATPPAGVYSGTWCLAGATYTWEWSAGAGSGGYGYPGQYNLTSPAGIVGSLQQNWWPYGYTGPAYAQGGYWILAFGNSYNVCTSFFGNDSPVNHSDLDWAANYLVDNIPAGLSWTVGSCSGGGGGASSDTTDLEGTADDIPGGVTDDPTGAIAGLSTTATSGGLSSGNTGIAVGGGMNGLFVPLSQLLAAGSSGLPGQAGSDSSLSPPHGTFLGVENHPGSDWYIGVNGSSVSSVFGTDVFSKWLVIKQTLRLVALFMVIWKFIKSCQHLLMELV